MTENEKKMMQRATAYVSAHRKSQTFLAKIKAGDKSKATEAEAVKALQAENVAIGAISDEDINFATFTWSPAIQAEFKSFGAYMGYKKAQVRGLIK